MLFHLSLFFASSWLYRESRSSLALSLSLPFFLFLVLGSSSLPASEDKEFFRNLVVENFNSTPYTALILNRSFEPVNDIRTDLGFSGYVRYRFYADVLQTYRGEPMGQLTYTITYEAGIAPKIIGKPELISLCQKNNNYFYPDNGYLLKASSELKNVLEELSEKNRSQESEQAETVFSACR